MEANTGTSEWNLQDFIEERYPKRSRKNKIDDLSQLDEPEPDIFINKAERLSKLPYPIEQILCTPEYAHDDIVLALPISEFTSDYIRNSGLLRPLMFNVPPEQLGMKMPNAQTFGVMDVLELVGGERRIEVVEVYEQKGTYMLLKDFVNYYNRRPSERIDLLNVLSLEFTSTKLADKVSAPAFVSEIDWIDNVWPKELFARQQNLLRQSAWARTNDFSTYPKVQRYCLMSVANCFTDFHIDFGGTSVWYHILKGEKVFWMIEPTKHNLKMYEEWILCGNANSTFFGALVDKCARVRLRQGDTLIIPSGWIHCVYTPVDSLVFGGNFLHSYSIPMQIRVSKSEDRIKIGSKYRFPHFKQMFWCFMAQIVRKATHRIYQKKLPEEAHNIATSTSPVQKNDEGGDEHLDKINEQTEKPVGVFHKLGALDSEESESEESASVIFDELPNNGDKKAQQSVEEGEICYDKSLGNANDGSYTFNPIQSIYDGQDNTPFTPAQHYDIEYLHSLPSLVVNGLFSLYDYAKRLLKSKQPEVIEGITRPHHLLKEFRALLDKINELGLVTVQLNLELSPKEICGKVEYTVPGQKESPVILSVKEPPKDEKRKMKRHGPADEEVLLKKTHKKKNVSTPSTANGTVLVDGLPLPTHLNTPSSSSGGFNPMGEIVKLGQKPMQSAWRKSSNMAKPPPPTHVHQLKKRFEFLTSNSDEQREAVADTSFNAFGMEKRITASEDYATAVPNAVLDNVATFRTQTASEGSADKEKKMESQRHRRKSIPKVATNKLIEIHDDSPEFSHRSPLQRLKGHETKASYQFQSDANAFNSRTSSTFASPNNYNRTPRNEMFGHQRNGSNQWGRGGAEDRNDNFRQHSNSWHSFGGGGGRGGRGRGGGEQWRRPSSGRGGYAQQHDRNYSRNWDSNPVQHRWSTDGNSGGGGFGEGRNDWNSFGNQSYDDTGFFNPVPNDSMAGFSSWNDTATSSNFPQPFESIEKNEAPAFEPVGFGNSSQNVCFEQNAPSFAPFNQPQQQQQLNYEYGQPTYRPPEPISNTVNELHHISQIMDAPSSVGLSDQMSVDQIPLPPSDRPSSSLVNLPKFSRFEAEGEQQQKQPTSALQQQSDDPFADVDELENITRMMQ